MDLSSRSSSSRRTRGSLAVSFIPSFSRGRPGHIRCSQGSLAPRSKQRAAAPGVSALSSRQRSRVTALFPADRLVVIAGPCVVEGDDLNLEIARELQRLSPKVPGGIVYKASFDKANRSNLGAARGPGMHEGLESLRRVKDATG